VSATRLKLALLASAAFVLAAPAGAAAAPDSDGDKLSNGVERRLADHPRARVIVSLRDEASFARVGRLERRTGVDALRRLPLVDSFSAKGTAAELRRLASSPAVARVEHDVRVSAHNDNAQAWFGVADARLQVPGLDGDGDGTPASYSSSDLVAAVIDTGVDPSHLELDDGKVLAFKDFVNDLTAAYDDDGHGTHVSGTIAGDGEGTADGRYRGVAPAAGLVGIKVLDENGNGFTSDVIAGINWAVANRNTYGIEAINLSLGSDGCADGDDAEGDAVSAAHAAGLVVVVSAGNDGPDRCTIGMPGAAVDALTVGAMADLSVGGFFAAAFSSRGPTADGRVKPDVMGPGVSIASAAANTGNGYSSWNGTSMSAPFVTGVALLMRDAAPSLTPAQVKATISSTAIDFGPSGPDSDWGAGRLDAYAALAAAGAPLTSPPGMPGHAHVSGTLSSTGSVLDFPVEVTDPSLPLAATLIRKTSALDSYKAAWISPSGGQLGSATAELRQGVVTVDPSVAGTYTLRVSSLFGSGGFDADLSGGFTSPPIEPGPSEPDPGTIGPTDTGSPAGDAEPVDLAGVVRVSARGARRALAAMTARKLRRRGAFSFDAKAPGAGRYEVYVRSGTLAVARGRRSFSSEGEARLRVKLTRSGRKLLRFSKRARCAVYVSFTTDTGATASAKAVTRPRRAAAPSRR
jgi:serine protease AprX